MFYNLFLFRSLDLFFIFFYISLQKYLEAMMQSHNLNIIIMQWIIFVNRVCQWKLPHYYLVLAHRSAATALITASLPEGSARRCEGPGVFKTLLLPPPNISTRGSLSGSAKSGRFHVGGNRYLVYSRFCNRLSAAALSSLNGGGELPRGGVTAALQYNKCPIWMLCSDIILLISVGQALSAWHFNDSDRWTQQRLRAISAAPLLP